MSLAQAACESRGWSLNDRLAVVQQDRVATFLLKKTPFTAEEVALLRATAADLDFKVLYAPGQTEADNDYARLALSPNPRAFYAGYGLDVRPTTDDRPFFFHTTKIRDQFQTAFGRSMLFGNGLSALMTLMMISAVFVVLFVVGPLALAGSELRGTGWPRWLCYFGLLGAGFMLVEVSLLQRFVLLLGHPVYSLTVTLFSLLLGTGAGSLLSQRISDAQLQRRVQLVLLGIVVVALLGIIALPPIIAASISASRLARIALAVALITPAGVLMGMPLPAGVRLLAASHAELVPVGLGHERRAVCRRRHPGRVHRHELGFSVTLLTGAATYLTASVLLRTSYR